MPSRKQPSPAEHPDAVPAYQYVFTRHSVEEAEVDLESLRLRLPSAKEARNADLAAIHAMTGWNEEEYLREFFHRNPGMLRQVRNVINHLKRTHDRAIAVTELMPAKLGADRYVLDQCCRRGDATIDPGKGIYPPRLVKMSEAFVSAGYIIPETKRLIDDHPADALDIAQDALQWSSEHHRQARPLDQTMTRYLIEKLLREGYLGSPRSFARSNDEEPGRTR